MKRVEKMKEEWLISETRERIVIYSEVLQNDNYSIGLCVAMKFSTPIIIVMVEWIGNNKTFPGDN